MLVVGAPHANNGGNDEGAAYFYVYNDVTGVWDWNSWWWINYLDGEFGSAVAVHGDNAWVGAPLADSGAVDAGSVTSITWNGTFYDWNTSMSSSIPGANLGASIAVGPAYAAHGMPGVDGPDGTKADMGAVIATKPHNTAVLIDEFYPTDGAAGDRFGGTLALYDGTLAAGSPGSGAPVRVYELSEMNASYLVASQTAYFGTFGLNQVALDASPVEPKMGGSWQPSLDHSAMTTTPIIAFLGLTTGSADLPLGPGFELLIDIGGPVFTFISPDTVNFSIPMPTDCLHAGLTFYAQAGGVDAFGALELVDPGYQLVMGY